MIFFIKNLVYLRKKSGLTQTGLADEIGSLKRNTISNYENNVTVPDISILSKLTKFFEVSADDILFTDLSDGKSEAEKNTSLEQLKSDVDQLKESVSQLMIDVKKLVRNDSVNSETINEHKKHIFELKAKLNSIAAGSKNKIKKN